MSCPYCDQPLREPVHGWCRRRAQEEEDSWREEHDQSDREEYDDE